MTKKNTIKVRMLNPTPTYTYNYHVYNQSEEYSSVKVGDLVKITIFDAQGGENVWVTITKIISDQEIKGKIDGKRQIITFGTQHIRNVWVDPNPAPSDLSLDRINELLLDEQNASKDYAKLIPIDPHFKVLSKQEQEHYDFLIRLKARLFGSKDQ